MIRPAGLWKLSRVFSRDIFAVDLRAVDFWRSFYAQLYFD